MTRRAWILAAVGALLAASLGGFVLATSGSSAPFKPLASWGVFTPAQWDVVSEKVERRGFAPASIHVVEAAGQPDKRPFALVAAVSTSGRGCFVPVSGTKLGQTLCQLGKPVVLWTSKVRWGHIRVTNVLGVARRDIVGISVDQLFDGHRMAQNLALIENAGMLTFAGGVADASALRARDAGGHVLFRLTFPR